MVKLYGRRRKHHRSMRAFGCDLGFPNMSSTALLSVTISNSLPARYKCSFSQAHTTASASRSTCEYLRSTSDSVALSYLMTLMVSFGFAGSNWRWTLAMPTGLASTTNLVLSFGSKYPMASLVKRPKNGPDFNYFSRNLREAEACKVEHLKELIPRAFPNDRQLILDAVVLMYDSVNQRPLPLDTLAAHKENSFRDATV